LGKPSVSRFYLLFAVPTLELGLKVLELKV